IKKIIKPLYIWLISSRLIKLIRLFNNFSKDLILYKRYSLTFRNKDLENKEADLILNYHSLEKGMLFKKMKKGFARNRIKNLHIILNDPDIILNIKRSQITVGYQVMAQYYELHQNENYNIEDIYTYEQYLNYKSILHSKYDINFNGVINWEKEKFYKDSTSNFLNFARSRKSVREFTGELISHDILIKVVELANTAPSVCNRQASKVYLEQDKVKIDQLLKIQ